MGRTRARSSAGITLDAGALIALDRGEKRMIALLDRALAEGRAFRVPAGVLGRVWGNGVLRLPSRGFCDEVQVVSLDDQLARVCGELCGAVGTADVTSTRLLSSLRRDGETLS